MTSGLKNAGATYQKAIQKCLKTQIGKNIEAYVDDVVVLTYQYRRQHSYSTSLSLLMWSARFSSPNEKKKGRPILFNDLYIM
jgi:hypothetical protein